MPEQPADAVDAADGSSFGHLNADLLWNEAQSARIGAIARWQFEVPAAAHLVMGVVYFAVVTPIGLLSRLVRGDTLHRRPDRNARSYWIERPHRSGSRRYLRQF